jgi:hypothetical protein
MPRVVDNKVQRKDRQKKDRSKGSHLNQAIERMSEFSSLPLQLFYSGELRIILNSESFLLELVSKM